MPRYRYNERYCITYNGWVLTETTAVSKLYLFVEYHIKYIDSIYYYLHNDMKFGSRKCAAINISKKMK